MKISSRSLTRLVRRAVSIIVLAAGIVALPALAKTDKEPYACASPTIEQAGLVSDSTYLMLRKAIIDASANLQALTQALIEAQKQERAAQAALLRIAWRPGMLAEKEAARLAVRLAQDALASAVRAQWAAEGALWRAETALAQYLASLGAVAIDVACVTAIAVGTVAVGYECYDIYSSGSTYVGTGTGGWWDFMKETGRNYGHYACFWR
jgi:hypothetical protein